MLLVLLDLFHHVVNHVLILAVQSFEFAHVFPDALDPLIQYHAHGLDDIQHLSADILAHDVPLGGQHLVSQCRFQRPDAAALENGSIALYFAEQCFLCRNGIDVALRDPEVPGRFVDLAVDLPLYFVPVTQIVPQPVDLVEYDQATLGRAALGVADVFLPDLDVGFSHTGIRCQDKQHRMRARKQTQCQLRFGAERIEAGCIENDKTLFQQRVRKINDRMSPSGDFHHAVCSEVHAVLAFFLSDVQTHGLCDFPRHGLDLGDVLQCLGNLLRGIHVQREGGPLVGKSLEFGDGGTADTGLDRQQTDVRAITWLADQLGRTHGGATGARRQDPLTESGKENGINELGLAAGELRDKGDVELVVAQRRKYLVQTLIDLRVGNLLRAQPAAECGDRIEQTRAPGAVSLKLPFYAVHSTILEGFLGFFLTAISNISRHTGFAGTGGRFFLTVSRLQPTAQGLVW